MNFFEFSEEDAERYSGELEDKIRELITEYTNDALERDNMHVLLAASLNVVVTTRIAESINLALDEIVGMMKEYAERQVH